MAFFNNFYEYRSVLYPKRQRIRESIRVQGDGVQEGRQYRRKAELTFSRTFTSPGASSVLRDRAVMCGSSGPLINRPNIKQLRGKLVIRRHQQLLVGLMQR